MLLMGHVFRMSQARQVGDCFNSLIVSRHHSGQEFKLNGQMFCGAYTQQSNKQTNKKKKVAKREIWGLQRENDEMRSCVLMARAGMYAGRRSHTDALCSPPPASCF